MDLPLPNAYWVLPGRILAGEHPYGTGEAAAADRVRRLLDAGIDSFVDLTEVDEMPDYRPLLPAGTAYRRVGIIDASVPQDMAVMRELQSYLSESLEDGRRLYIHCRAGIGRTGLVVGCYLAQGGLGGRATLKELNRLWLQSARSQSWPEIPQTLQQAQYIRRWARDLRPARRPLFTWKWRR